MNKRHVVSAAPAGPPQPTHEDIRKFRRRIGVGMTPEPKTAWQAEELAIEALHRASGIVALAGHLGIREVDTEGLLEHLVSELGDAMAVAHQLIGQAILPLTEDWSEEPEEGQP